MSNPDTRVALVGEDTARERLERACFDKNDETRKWKRKRATIPQLVTAVLAELFPETDTPLRVVDVRQLLDDAKQCAVFWDRDGYDGNAGEVRDNTVRLEEELNRG